MREFSTYDDRELWKEIREGSRTAFNILMDRHWEKLFETAYKGVRSVDVAKDLVQDIFLHVWLKKEDLEIENPEAYFRTSIRFRVYSYFSRNKFPADFSKLFDHATDPSYLASNRALYADLKKLVHAWINTQPLKRRQIFILYLEDQLSTREIADKLNIAQKTVQNQLNRAMGSLRSKISDHLFLLLFF